MCKVRFDILNDELRSAEVECADGIASLVLGPNCDLTERAIVLSSIWSLLEVSPEVRAVRVVASSAGQQSVSRSSGVGEGVALGPKSNGLLKPFGIGIIGPARNEVLQLIGEADVVVATADATFADTNLIQGFKAVNAVALGKVMPLQEAARIALLGEKGPMSSERALQLKVIDVLVLEGEVEPELDRRLRRLAPPR